MREVSDLLSKHALLDHTEIRPGWFEETLASLPSDQRFCFLHVDCDLYDSTKTCLHHLYDKVVDGGIIVFDDYFDIGAGERKAVDEFLAEHGNELLFAGPTEQVFFFKGRQTFPKNRPSLLTLPEGTVVSLAFLADNTEYLDDLKKDVLMPELRGGSLGKAAELARQTLKIYNYHQSVLQRLEKA
jgi:O-methyltransferase